jgi:hypothetical protein
MFALTYQGIKGCAHSAVTRSRDQRQTSDRNRHFGTACQSASV